MEYAKSQLCPTCALIRSLCLCSELQVFKQLPSPTQFVILRHRTEIEVQSNTAQAVPLLFPNAITIEHGLKGPPTDLAASLEAGAAVLFPDPSSTELEAGPLPRQLILLDGSWRKARRMLRRVPELHGLPKVRLGESPLKLSEDRLRKQHDPIWRNTLEAALEAVLTSKSDDHLAERVELAKKWLAAKLHQRGRKTKAELGESESAESTTD